MGGLIQIFAAVIRIIVATGDGVFQRVAREDHSEARSPRVRFLLGLAWWLQASAWARLFAPWPCFAAGIPVAADMWANQLRAFSLHLQR